jgi:malate dehydrogenase
MTIWGNHSDTQYPDYKNARINGLPATKAISDAAWFDETFIPTVAKRGSAVIKARGASSAASAANAIVDSLHSITKATPSGDCYSAAVLSDGSYDVPAGLIYSFPLVSKGASAWSIVPGVPIDAEARKRLDASAAELIAERDAIKELLGPAI